MKLITTSLLFLVISFSTFGQTDPKMGYTNVEYLISKLPEAKKIAEELEKQKKQYDLAYEQKVKEFQDKFATYQKSGASMPDIIKKDKEKELETMQAAIQELQQNAQKDLQTKQGKMIQPIYVKVYTAIQNVAEENGYKFIYNTGDSNQMRNLLVAPIEGDVSELVLKKLGAIAKEEVKAKAAEAKIESAAKTETKKAATTSKKPVAKAPVKKKK